MLTSFARAVQAQANGCSCHACSRAASAIPGRVIPRPARRKISIADAFTACYTTIMATAAVMDASAEPKRKEDSTRRIEEARARVLQLVEDSASREVAHYTEQVRQSAIQAAEPGSEAMHAIASICLSRNQLFRTEAISWVQGTFANQLRKRYQLDRRKYEPLSADFDRIKTGIVLEEETFLAQREAKTDIHMERTRTMIKHLANKLLLQAYREDDKIEPGVMQRHLRMLDSAWGYMKMLRHEGYPKFTAVHDGEEESVKVRRALSEANDRIMDRNWRPDRIRHPVAKICYNLMVSRYPPSIHSYNSLIAGFLREGELGLSKVVIDSFLYESQFRATQQTIVCLLNHYSMANDLAGFYGTIRRIAGLDQRGMRIRQAKIHAVSRKPKLQEWASGPEVTIAQDYFVQRAKLDFDVADALINGLLHFDRLEHAAKVFIAVLQEKIDIDVSTLVALANRCVSDFNYFASRLVLSGLLQNLGDTLNLIYSHSGTGVALQSLNQLLSFCRPPRTQSPSVDGRLGVLKRALRMKQLESWLRRMGRIATAMDRVLRASTLSWEHRVTVSCAIWKNSQRSWRRRALQAAQLEEMYGMGMLEHYCIRLDTQIRDIEYELLAVLAENSPGPLRRYIRRGSHPLDVRLQDHLAARSLSRFAIQTQILGHLVHSAEQTTRTLLRGALPPKELERLAHSSGSIYSITPTVLAQALERTVYQLARTARPPHRWWKGRKVSQLDDDGPADFLAPFATVVR